MGGCNKDDKAMGARQIAEKKMEANDFEGARKIVMEAAQKLSPKLDDDDDNNNIIIKQMLIICDVHCSAQVKMGGNDKDWYGILQIKKFADESTVKKQYKTLALLLHPDKNRFPGAEAAFKLICEANEVLSDPQKKSLHDSKIRVAESAHDYYHGYTNTDTSIYPNVFYYGKKTQVSIPVARPIAFWTKCTFCGRKYYFVIEYLNTHSQCGYCSK
ncbi:hypothetical protein ACP275_12G126400 [Erythranthe tilingii]